GHQGCPVADALGRNAAIDPPNDVLHGVAFGDHFRSLNGESRHAQTHCVRCRYSTFSMDGILDADIGEVETAELVVGPDAERIAPVAAVGEALFRSALRTEDR